MKIRFAPSPPHPARTEPAKLRAEAYEHLKDFGYLKWRSDLEEHREEIDRFFRANSEILRRGNSFPVNRNQR